jgi:hypothetical protein
MWGKCWDTTNQIVEKEDRDKIKLKALVIEELPTFIFDECKKLHFRCLNFKGKI